MRPRPLAMLGDHSLCDVRAVGPHTHAPLAYVDFE